MKIKRSKYDIIVNIVCLILLIGIIAFLVLAWKGIPDKIPGHYNFAGDIDRWGNKGELLFLPILSWILYLGMTVVEHFPQIWNTGVTVTEENKERVYRILKDMFSTVKLIVVAVLSYLTINSALMIGGTIWSLPILLILMFGTIIFFVMKLIRAK